MVEPTKLTAPEQNTSPDEVIRQQRTQQDFVVLRIAVGGLIAVILVALVGTMILAGMDSPLPDGIMAAGSAAVGALATMLVRQTGNGDR